MREKRPMVSGGHCELRHRLRPSERAWGVHQGVFIRDLDRGDHFDREETKTSTGTRGHRHGSQNSEEGTFLKLTIPTWHYYYITVHNNIHTFCQFTLLCIMYCICLY